MSVIDASMSRRRPVIIALVVVLGVVWFLALSTRRSTTPGAPQIDLPALPKTNLDYLHSYIETSQFTYARRTIKTRHFEGERKELTVVNGDLFPPPQVLDNKGGAEGLSRAEIPEAPPLELHIPQSPIVNTSIISFGVATSAARLNESAPQFFHWLPHSGAPLHVISPPDDNIPATQDYMRSLGIDTTIVSSSVDFPVAYFSVIKQLYDNRLPQTQWIALLDDDTFVPSLPTLIQHLTGTYDSSKEVLIGAMSDNLDQIHQWGLEPFGGGGIFISIPLAARMTSPKIWDQCSTGMGLQQGDLILSSCLNQHTEVRPKFDEGLNQMDIVGNPAGYFECGRRMLTVHHWRTWFQLDIPMCARVSRASGAEGVFQRWSFPSQNFVLSNGYSIVEYPQGLDAVDLSSVEKTWEGDAAKFLHKIGPLRPAMGGEKVSHMLVATDVEEKFVRQVYLNKAKDEKDMDHVLELIWVL